MDNDRELLDIESIRARHAAATKGPYKWRANEKLHSSYCMCSLRGEDNNIVASADSEPVSYAGCNEFIDISPANQDFLAASWQDVADLIAEVERLRAENAALKSVAQWAQATLTALNGGDVQRESLLHQKLREVMIQYRAALDAAGAPK